ncbi:hypothetical protein [Sporolactobacillus laevolacticus]|uniref:hypothetical protein n=1 Tax=Sporolactobacillus laevolacticus TaxID=33018 RepID=UPI0025B57044|nr:hypothetical protein [Sporolactobacillus laevolacticus]MDN3956636.1 hypothetical protein [Sporolactobacillus laevolacticus]
MKHPSFGGCFFKDKKVDKMMNEFRVHISAAMLGKNSDSNMEARDACGAILLIAGQERPRRCSVDRGGSRTARGKRAAEVSFKHKIDDSKPHIE